MKVARAYTGKLSFRRLKYSMVSGWLYVLNLLTGRKLELTFISEPEPVIFSNGYFTLYWELKGCHQISVNNVVLPGITRLIRLDPMQLAGSLELRFYGCRQTLVKTYALSPVDLRTKQLAKSLIQEPKLEQWGRTPSLLKRPGSVHLPSISLSAGLRFQTRLETFTICTSMHLVPLESCEIPHYNP